MIRVKHDLTEAEQAAHEAVYGRYNDFPPGWREVADAEIATDGLGRIYTPTLMEYRQMGLLVAGSPPMIAATLSFFHDGSGHAVCFDYHGKRVRWFRFERCAHTYVEISRPAGNRSGLHTDRCSRCGYETSYDTSD